MKSVKRCTKCGVCKAIEEFSSDMHRIDGLDLHCRECIRERVRNKKYRHLLQGMCSDCGSPRGDSRSRRLCQRCLNRADGTQRSRDMRAAVLLAYGGESPGCICCGEQTRAFLTLDHVNNGGRAHRREKGNQGVYHELRKAGYPAGFQILCFNCNLARGLYGSCPHQVTCQELLQPITQEAGAPPDAPVRRCTRCNKLLALSAFYADQGTRSRLQSRCRVCTREASITRLNAARLEALMHYSSGAMRCVCCGEQEWKFLALDHIDGEGPHARCPSGWQRVLRLAQARGLPAWPVGALPQLQLCKGQERGVSAFRCASGLHSRSCLTWLG
jgi:hypothetical protein